MNGTHDELAGVVDLFGALTPQELTTALTELAFKRGKKPDEGAVAKTIEDAVEAYGLVMVDQAFLEDGAVGDSDEQLLVSGPTAFPSLPSAAEDLPHIMDVPRRTVDREAVGEAVLAQLKAAAATALEDDDSDRAQQLLDVSYDLEAWAPVAADEVREELAGLLEKEG